MVGVCSMSAERGVELTTHHVVEAPKDEDGKVRPHQSPPRSQL